MQFLAQYGLFLAKTVTWVAALLLLVAGIGSLLRSARQQTGNRLEIKNVNQRLRELADGLNEELLDAADLKKLSSARKKQQKLEEKRNKKAPPPPKPRVFVLDFDGDVQASAVTSLREEISALLQVARDEDEVLLRLESGGGLVHSYGLASSQLVRLRQRRLKLTVAVDKIAASGGYMMACVADQVIAAPFAIVGSIGVVAQIPNFNRLLRKHDIDLELHTAGEHKRTLTLFGENTEAGRAKFREEIQATHDLFKNFVAQNRPSLDLAKVATGEHWFGTQALDLKLIDKIATSDDYLLGRTKDADVYELRYRRRRPLSERVGDSLTRLATSLRRGARSEMLQPL
ncbi:MAG: sohB [Hydrocarboniphaga sp.]|uniref:protease SohB n=1 Tax=Hydrocarboniphaga sp. TaxID=2033016 RepID=UPI00262698E1|nr:protease SohB [Hydrocarboniphaga sp.]MDB5969433.1 sohB [Hydrocarboniphaga sp.]